MTGLLQVQTKNGHWLSLGSSVFEMFAFTRHKKRLVDATELFIHLALHAHWAGVDERADLVASVVGAAGNFLSETQFVSLVRATIRGAFRLGIVPGRMLSAAVEDKVAHEMLVICDRDEDKIVSLVEVSPTAVVFQAHR